MTRLLIDNGLLDELRVWLHPVLSGKAKSADLLYRDMPQTRFAVANTEVHETGLIIFTYVPKTST